MGFKLPQSHTNDVLYLSVCVNSDDLQGELLAVSFFVLSQRPGYCYSACMFAVLSAAEYVVMTTAWPPVADVDQDLSVCV